MSEPPHKRPRLEPADVSLPDLAAPATVTTPTAGGFTLQMPQLGLATPAMGGGMPSLGGAATPMMGGGGSRWGNANATPNMLATGPGATPNFGAWGSSTPAMGGGMMGQTPMMGGGVMGAGTFGETPAMGAGADLAGPTPVAPAFDPQPSDTDDGIKKMVLDARTAAVMREMMKRNRPMLDEEIDDLIPEGFDFVPVPSDYLPMRNSETNPNSEDYVEPTLEVIGENIAGSSNGLGGGGSGGPRKYSIPESLGHNMPIMLPDDAQAFEILLQYQNVGSDAEIPKHDLPSVNVMRALFKVKNGDHIQRRSGVKFIMDRVNLLGSALLFEHLFAIWRAHILDMTQRAQYVRLMERLLFFLGDKVTPQIGELVKMIGSLLAETDHKVRDQGKDLTVTLAKAVGVNPIVKEVMADMQDDNGHVRSLAAKILALVGQALGVDKLLKFLELACSAQVWQARQTGVKTIYELATMLKFGINKVLPNLVAILSPCIDDPDHRVSGETGNALSALAVAVAPFGIDHFVSVINPIRAQCNKGHGIKLCNYLKAMGNIILLMKEADATNWAKEMLRVIQRSFETQDDALKTVVLRVVQTCVSVEGVSALEVRESILDSFFTSFWTRRAVASKKVMQPLSQATLALAVRVGINEVLERLLPDMSEENEVYQSLVMETIRRIMVRVGTTGLLSKTEELLVQGALSALDADENGESQAVSGTCCAILLSLGARASKYLDKMLEKLRNRLENAQSTVRMQAASMLTELVPCIKEHSLPETLITITQVLYTKISQENEASVLAGQLHIVSTVLKHLPDSLAPDLSDPNMDDLAQQMSQVIKNPDQLVQQRCVELVGQIALKAKYMKEPSRLHNLATDGLFKLLGAPGRPTRRATIEAFGEIAAAVQPFQILTKLLDNLKIDERRTRICTEVAIAAVADKCGTVIVVPFLINEFLLPEALTVAETIQRGVLKSLRFLFEFVGAKGRHCAYAVLPLLERALTENNIQTRRMGCELARNLLLACAEHPGYEDLAIHCLNFVLPNIVELLHEHDSKNSNLEQERMLTSVIEVFEVARLIVSPGALLNYLVQGMHHPASKVRSIYWKTYNNFYLAYQDQVVPYYPEPFAWEGHNEKRAAMDEGQVMLGRKYHRHELDYLL